MKFLKRQAKDMGKLKKEIASELGIPEDTVTQVANSLIKHPLFIKHVTETLPQDPTFYNHFKENLVEEMARDKELRERIVSVFSDFIGRRSFLAMVGGLATSYVVGTQLAGADTVIPSPKDGTYNVLHFNPFDIIVGKEGKKVKAYNTLGKLIANGIVGVSASSPGSDTEVVLDGIKYLQEIGGGVLKIGSGDFYITNSLVLNNKIDFSGQITMTSYKPNFPLGVTKFISVTDNPVFVFRNENEHCASITLRNLEILPYETGKCGDAIFLDTENSLDNEVVDSIIEGVTVKDMGGWAINKSDIGNAYDLIIKNCGFTKNRLGNVNLQSGLSSVDILYCWAYSYDNTWNYKLHQAQIFGGVCGGRGNGINIDFGSIVGVDGEAGLISGTIGILTYGTSVLYILGGRWVKWGTCIQIGQTETDNANCVINTSTNNAVDGSEVVLIAKGGLTRVILLDIGDGVFENRGYPHQVLDLRFEHKKPLRQGRIQYLDTDVGLGDRGALFYETYTQIPFADGGVIAAPFMIHPGLMYRFYDDFIGAGLNSVWNVAAGTIATAAIAGGIAQLTTGAVAGDQAIINHNGIASIPLSTGIYKNTSLGFAIKFALAQTTELTFFAGLKTDSSNYTGIFADPSVSSNFLIRVCSGGTITDYDTGVALDTNYHTYWMLGFGGNGKHYFDGVLKVNNKPTHVGLSEISIELTTNEAVAKTVNVDFVDVWHTRQ